MVILRRRMDDTEQHDGCDQNNNAAPSYHKPTLVTQRLKLCWRLNVLTPEALHFCYCEKLRSYAVNFPLLDHVTIDNTAWNVRIVRHQQLCFFQRVSPVYKEPAAIVWIGSSDDQFAL